MFFPTKSLQLEQHWHRYRGQQPLPSKEQCQICVQHLEAILQRWQQCSQDGLHFTIVPHTATGHTHESFYSHTCPYVSRECNRVTFLKSLYQLVLNFSAPFLHFFSEVAPRWQLVSRTEVGNHFFEALVFYHGKRTRQSLAYSGYCSYVLLLAALSMVEGFSGRCQCGVEIC